MTEEEATGGRTTRLGRPRGGMKVAARIDRRGTAKRDNMRLATHLPSSEIPVWWRRAVLPSLLWGFFLSFRKRQTKQSKRETPKGVGCKP